jgi:lipopolysaccharide cholinephosphotransferase
MKTPIIPQDFYKEEELCGHIVTAKTKKLWATQLGCLQELQRICAKHDILYFASGGTLIGAVRHKGFIPWDDDLDVMMPYEDYVRFCEVAPRELSHPYFFQNYQTEPGFGPAMSRIRNSETTGCTLYDINMADENYNCGVFIDIFPLFGIENGWKRLKQKWSLKIWKVIITGSEIKRMASQGGWKWTLKKWLHPKVWLWNFVNLFVDHVGASKKLLNVCAGAKSYSQMGLLSFTGFNPKLIWNKEWFDEIITLPFEFTEIPCPKEYDPILRTQYGDYMKFVKGGQIHTMALCDPNMPYKKKLSERGSNHS